MNLSNKESSLKIGPSKSASPVGRYFFSSIAISILPGYDTTNYFVKSFCCVAIWTSSYEIQILIQVGSVSESWMAPFIWRVEASDNLKLTGQSWHCLPVNCKRSNRLFSGPKMSEVGHEFMTLCREESGGSNYSCTSQRMPVKRRGNLRPNIPVHLNGCPGTWKMAKLFLNMEAPTSVWWYVPGK